MFNKCSLWIRLTLPAVFMVTILTASVQAQNEPSSGNGSDSLESLLDLFGEGPAPEKPATSPADPPSAPEPVQVLPSPAGSSSPQPMPTGETVREAPAGMLQFNFRYANWDDVLRTLAEVSGLTLDMQTTPPGSFSYFDKEPKTPVEALDILNGYLIQRGYILVRRDNFLIAVSIEKGIPANLVPTIDLEDLPNRGSNELIRIVFDLNTTRAEDLVEDVRSQLGPQGEVVSMGATNRLVVTGLGQNLRRVDKLLAGSKLAAGPNDLNFRAFTLKHIPASDAEPTIRALLGVQLSMESNSSSSSRSSSRGGSDPRAQFMEMMAQRMQGGDSGRGRGDSGRSSESSSSSSSTAGQARITVDSRTNSLLIAAKQADLLIVEQAIEQIDLPAREGQTPFKETGGLVLRVYEIEDGELDEIAQTLMAMVPGVMINEDDRADVLHVVGTEAAQREIAELIRTIVSKGSSNDVGIVPLFRLDPDWALLTLSNLFANEAAPPIIQPDLYGQNLIVRGNSDHLLQVKTLILQMSQAAGNQPDIFGVNSGPVRQIPLGGQDPADLLPMLQQMWKSSGRTPLRVVRPENRDPVREETTEPKSKPDENDSVQHEGNRTLYTIPVVFQTEEKTEPPKADEKKSSPAEDSGISLTIIGDQLIISGQDETELNALQSMITKILQQYASKTKWTIYYLRSSEASATAEMLRQLFPDIDVSGTTSRTTTSSFGSRLTTQSATQPITPESIRIIPETRSNALYIAGPADRVREIEDVLRVLDSSELPESYRNRVARSIPVKYASVDDVAGVLKEVFVDLLPQQTQNRRGQGGGDDGGTSLVAGELTLGVDSNTSQIIVSCNETLFRQVEELVQSLDEAAREAKRTVRVVNLDYANAADVQKTLGTLIPKVTFSTSSSGRVSTSTSNSNNSSNNNNSSSNSSSSSRDGGSDRSSGSSDDSRRRFFEDMMRRRSEGGGDSSRSGSSRDGGGDRGRGR